MKKLLTVVLLMLGTAAWSTTYYIAANGSDANNGTAKTTPWLHAPGMTGCTGNCAAKVPQAGDNFILRGGDAWYPAASGKTPVGIPWLWNPGPAYDWNGTANAQIYVGVDSTWYSGTSWSRPKLNGGNPLSTSVVSSCQNTASNFLWNQGWYVTFDNLEFLGLCSIDQTGNTFSTMGYNTHHSKFLNFYYHGWTYTGTHGQRVTAIQGATSGNQYWPKTNNEFAYIVMDGSDASPQSLTGLYGDCYNFHHNYLTRVCNAIVCNNMHTTNNNVFEYVDESLAPNEDHGNVFETNAESPEGNFFYNNVIRHIGKVSTIGVNVWLNNSSTDYYYNNLLYDISVAGNNYWNQQGVGSVYFFNNTLQHPDGQFTMIERATYSYNNHYIGLPVFITAPSSGNTANDLTQTNTTANHSGTGYTAANGYAPTAGYHPTSGAGTNLTSYCGAAGAALCQDATLGVGYDAMHHRVILNNPAARPATGSWDIGAYQYVPTKIRSPQSTFRNGVALSGFNYPNPIKAVLLYQYLQSRINLTVCDVHGEVLAKNIIHQPGIYLVKEKNGNMAQKVVVIR